jgi:hypothetical protein
MSVPSTAWPTSPAYPGQSTSRGRGPTDHDPCPQRFAGAISDERGGGAERSIAMPAERLARYGDWPVYVAALEGAPVAAYAALEPLALLGLAANVPGRRGGGKPWQQLLGSARLAGRTDLPVPFLNTDHRDPLSSYLQGAQVEAAST